MSSEDDAVRPVEGRAGKKDPCTGCPDSDEAVDRRDDYDEQGMQHPSTRDDDDASDDDDGDEVGGVDDACAC